MPTEIKLWKIDADKPVNILQQKIDFEKRLEDWIVNDIGLINNGMLIIGQQVPTEFGGIIDILAIDYDGNLVILELKRDKTSRDIVAQILDYASCIKGWGAGKIIEIADDFLQDESLESLFRNKFRKELPEILNERHRMYIVASKIDSASERIVTYLSETHDLDINVITFAFFQIEQVEVVARSFLLDEVQVETRSKSKSKRKPPLSWEELKEIAERNSVEILYEKAFEGLKTLFDSTARTQSNYSFIGYMGDNKSRNSIISIFPGASSEEIGLAVGIQIDRLTEYFGIAEERIHEVLGEPNNKVNELINEIIVGSSYWASCYGLNEQSLEDLIELLRNSKIEA
jgi:hypothetical protein